MPKSPTSSSASEQSRVSIAQVSSLTSLSPLASEVLDLYASELAEVRFPDLDLATLHTLADELYEAQQQVDRLEAEAHDARERVASCSAQLDARAERALAYARIFAEGKPELTARVDAVRPRSPGQANVVTPKRRGRPRRAETHEGQLDVLDSAAE